MVENRTKIGSFSRTFDKIPVYSRRGIQMIKFQYFQGFPRCVWTEPWDMFVCFQRPGHETVPSAPRWLERSRQEVCHAGPRRDTPVHLKRHRRHSTEPDQRTHGQTQLSHHIAVVRLRDICHRGNTWFIETAHMCRVTNADNYAYWICLSRTSVISWHPPVAHLILSVMPTHCILICIIICNIYITERRFWLVTLFVPGASYKHFILPLLRL